MTHHHESIWALRAASPTNVHSSYWIELVGVRAERSVLKGSKVGGMWGKVCHPKKKNKINLGGRREQGEKLQWNH